MADSRNNGGANERNYLNYGQDDQMEIQGYRSSRIKKILTSVFYVLTLGVLRLIFHWYPHLWLKATHTQCSLGLAEKVLITDTYKNYRSYYVKTIGTFESPLESKNPIVFNVRDGCQKMLYKVRTIRCKKLMYIWDEESDEFLKLSGFDEDLTRIQLHAFRGQNQNNQNRLIYGNNEIEVPVQTIMTLLALEVLSPFYMFQIASIVIWTFNQYYYYIIALVAMSCSGIVTSVVQTRQNQERLRGTIFSKSTAVVLRDNGTFEEVSSTSLVPGDVISIPVTGCKMRCDAVLISGDCVTNESMLTGESLPIRKTMLPKNDGLYNLKEDVIHTLFCGTKVIQTRTKGTENVLAVVIRTGYLTTKGELVRTILYPPPADFKFETDSYKFIALLAMVSVVGVVYTIISKLMRGMGTLDTIEKALDVITIAVPPALPAAMTVGKVYALNRLKKIKVYCINSRVINVSGSINCICFDKTGTLTEDELDMWGVVPVVQKTVQKPLKDPIVLSHNSPFKQGMATCHSLSLINGELCGDPLDFKMFEASGSMLLDSDDNHQANDVLVKSIDSEDDLEMAIMKQFHFSSNLQRMSVIVQPNGKPNFSVFCKGAPEMIMSLCDSSSVPNEFEEVLEKYTTQGYRVLGLAHKELELEWNEIDALDRDDVEYKLQFLGFIILENKLKRQTIQEIRVLKNANMKLVMITGDNIQTALQIARESEMVDPDQAIIEVVATPPTNLGPARISYQLQSSASQVKSDESSFRIDLDKNIGKKFCLAVHGSSWANVLEFFPDLIPKIVTKGTVFARMSGHQKQQLIEELKSLGYYVVMCGDGANDCSALKAANVGISLSDAESSIASPFTYKDQNISCVSRVVKEGRAALVTSFGVFKVMLCYSQLQFASTIILYAADANINSFQFFYIDVFLLLCLISVFGNTKAYEALDKTPPRPSLMDVQHIASVIFFLLITTSFQVIANYYITTYEWFKPYVFNGTDSVNFYSYENYIVFSTSLFQYIMMIIVFSRGKPYRQPIFTNKLLTLLLIVTTAHCVYVVLYPACWLQDLFVLRMPPIEGRLLAIIISVICFPICLFTEEFIVEYLIGKIIMPNYVDRDSSRIYLNVDRPFEEDIYWPQGEFNRGFVQ